LIRRFILVLVLLALLDSGERVLAERQGKDISLDDYFELTAEELMEVKVGVASRKELAQKEAPGIVTVVTRDQIIKSGARDLVDILRLVPGFDVGFDTVGAYGVGIRGIWANEGKVLVLMDGVEMNDDMYSTFQYHHHIPVDIIERVEIMRGPGSAMYGDSAELGVIKITTISPQKESEALVSSTYSRMKETFGKEGVTGFYGTKKDDLSISVASCYESGNFSDRTSGHYDYYGGNAVDMGDNGNSRVRSRFLNVGLNAGNLSVRGIIDRYGLNSPWPGSTMYKMNFDSDIIEAKYKLPVNDNLSVTSRFVYKHQKPWSYPYVTYSGSSFRITSEKYMGETFFSYDMEGGHNIVAGAQYDQIRGRDDNRSGLLEGGRNKVSYYNTAYYGEGFFKTALGSLTVGGRYVNHNFAGSKFVPRVALTKAMGPHYIKALYSKAYRTPAVMNIAYNDNIKPEETTIYEFELGSQVTDSLHLSANVFDVEITNPIIYFYSGTSSYTNFDRTASRGAEFSGLYKKGTTDVMLTYSYYRARDNKVDEYKVPGHGKMMLGMPSHKISLSASVSPYKDLFVTPSFTYFSPRYAVTGYGSDYVYNRLDSKLLTNISLLFKNAFNKNGLDLSLSVYNLLGEKYDFVEPYLGWYGPVPGPSREFVIKLMYRF